MGAGSTGVGTFLDAGCEAGGTGGILSGAGVGSTTSGAGGILFDAGGRASSAEGTHSGERIQSWRRRSHSFRRWRYTFSHLLHSMRRREHLFGRRKQRPHFQLENAQHQAQEAFFPVQELCSRRRRHTFIYSMHGLGRTKQSVGCRKHSVMRRRHSGRPAF